MRKRQTCTLFVLIALSVSAYGQQRALQAYGECKLKDFVVEETDYLPHSIARTIKTTTGEQTVVVSEGARVLITYKDRPFLNLKVERFDKSSFHKDKSTLIDGVAQAAAGSNDMDTSALKMRLSNRIEIYGIDRKQLEGGVLSIYLMVDEKNLIVMTGYFLNDYPEERKFNTVEEYRVIRDLYIKSFTECLSRPR
jgi:hypothetical protein